MNLSPTQKTSIRKIARVAIFLRNIQEAQNNERKSIGDRIADQEGMLRQDRLQLEQQLSAFAQRMQWENREQYVSKAEAKIRDREEHIRELHAERKQLEAYLEGAERDYNAARRLIERLIEYTGTNHEDIDLLIGFEIQRPFFAGLKLGATS